MSNLHHRMKVVRARDRADLRALPELLGIGTSTSNIPMYKLPFNPEELTIGTESEYQTAVQGGRAHTDLPRTIEESANFANISRRVKAGDIARRSVSRLESAGELFVDARFVLALQALFAVAFIYLGVSTVTRSEIRFSTDASVLPQESVETIPRQTYLPPAPPAVACMSASSDGDHCV